MVGEISAASNEQAQGIEQVNIAVAEMEKVTQQNAASSEESASASEELMGQAEQMKSFVQELEVLVGVDTERSGKKKIAAPQEFENSGMMASIHEMASTD